MYYRYNKYSWNVYEANIYLIFNQYYSLVISLQIKFSIKSLLNFKRSEKYIEFYNDDYFFG